MVAVGVVEVAHEVLHAFVPTAAVFFFQQEPIERLVVIPLAALREFAAHKQQFFAGETIHKAVIRAQVSEFLPSVARHFGEQRAFAVYHFVVRQRQDKVFAVLIHHAEGHQIVVVFAVNRIFLHIAQSVVHPAHIPFVLEIQAFGAGHIGK